MTGRRRSYPEYWAPMHDMSVEDATAKFPRDPGIASYGRPNEVADLMGLLVMGLLVAPGSRWLNRSSIRMDVGWLKSI
jgi:hypothetical protein